MERADVLIDPKCQLERAILEKIEQGGLRPLRTPEQIGRLGQNRLANEQRCFQLRDAGGGPEMISFRTIESRYEGPSVNDGSHHARSP